MAGPLSPVSRSLRPPWAVLVAALLLPVAVAYGIMARFSLNVPLIDDYPTIMGFAVTYKALPTAGARWHYILADQYTEYKLVFIHVLTAAQLAVAGKLSFSFIFWLGQLCLVGMLVVLWKSHLRRETDLTRRLALFLPVAFMLFGLNYGEALDWVACCIGYLMTILLSMVALYLLEGKGWRFGAACAAAVLACSIAANAFLLLPLGLVALALRRAYGRAMLWGLAFVLALVPYFVHYAPEMHSGKGSYGLIPAFFLGFLGAASPYYKLAFPLGAGVLVVYLISLRTGFYRTHGAAVLGMTWLLGSAALAAVGRGRTGLSFATTSRYKIYSDLFLIYCYGYLVDRVAHSGVAAGVQRRLYGAALAVSVLFCAHGDVQGYRMLRGRYAMQAGAYRRYLEAPAVNSPMYFGDPRADEFFAGYEDRAREETNAAVAAGLYEPPR